MDTQEEKRKIVKLDEIVRKLSSSCYVNELFDPIQTHAVYGVRTKDVNFIKEELKKLKANRFRTVKANNKEFSIICFKADKMDL